MAVILTHVLSCCLSRKSSKSKDEESHLIPPNTEITPSYSSSPGPQAFRERMLDIVRSKESKMVNVSARMPFHLHNKNDVSIACEGAVSKPADALSISPTYSRSVSASSLPRDLLCSRPSVPRSPMYASRFRMSRSSSVTFPNDYTLMTEIYPENQLEEHSVSGARVRTSRSPAFNIRVVRELCRRHAADISGMRRGRPRTKANSENGDPEGADDLLSGIPSRRAQSASQVESPESDKGSSTNLQFGDQGEASGPVSPPSTTDFDIGPLVIGWDD